MLRKSEKDMPKKPTKKPPPKKPNPTKPRPRKNTLPEKIPAKSALLLSIPKVSLLQFAATSRALLLARQKSNDTLVTLYDLESQSESPPLKARPKTSAIALSPDNLCLALATSSGILAVQSTHTGKLLWKSKAGQPPIRQILFSLDGSLLFAAAEPADEGDAWLRAVKTATGEPDPAFEPTPGTRCSHLALSPDGLFLACSEIRSNTVLLWHLPTRQLASVLRLPKERGPIADLAFGSSIKHLVIAQKHQLSTWNAENGERDRNVDASIFLNISPLPLPGILAITRLENEAPVLELRGLDTLHLRRTISLPAQAALASSPDSTLLALTLPNKQTHLYKSEKL